MLRIFGEKMGAQRACRRAIPGGGERLDAEGGRLRPERSERKAAIVAVERRERGRSAMLDDLEPRPLEHVGLGGERRFGTGLRARTDRGWRLLRRRGLCHVWRRSSESRGSRRRSMLVQRTD